MTAQTGQSPTALIGARAAEAPLNLALAAPGRSSTTYEALVNQTLRGAGMLRGAGVGREDRVALVVENGPEAAAAFLAVSSAASCAPLNPAYRTGELEFYLGDLAARAVVVGANIDSPVRDVAAQLGVAVLELVASADAPAGAFTLDGVSEVAPIEPPDPEAEALVLHTSGTTARPKLVPLTHRKLAWSARNVAATLALRAEDRCLNLMPLFHIHGLVASLLASLVSGGSVACTPGFHRGRALDGMRNSAATWTTAVPTMYQAILELVEREPELLRGHGLRLARSSSAALPALVFERLERVLGVPVIEAYGMTEAAHQMASNPLPPGVRKPGSVGLPAGPEIAVLDDDWNPLPAHEAGEVAIRGEQVFAGYGADPEANTRVFRDGWFRTGDIGWLDEDGYLFLSGRLKEIVNRGGEKVSPLEVDDVLLRHPAVAEAVTFGVPDERLGEEVAAAIVVRDGRQTSEAEVQDFVAQTIAPFKVPRRIIVVDEIPKGPTGKVQRVSLATSLQLTGTSVIRGHVRHPGIERRLQEIWADVLELPTVDPLDDFFALGGDSILGAEAVSRVRDVFAVDVPLVAIVRSPSPRAMTAEIVRGLGWDGDGIVCVQAGDRRPRPLHYVHGADGEIIGVAAVARRLDPSRGVYGLRPPTHVFNGGLSGGVEALATAYLEQIRGVQPDGPYLIVGFCMGAAVVLELAHRLEHDGSAAGLVLVDPRVQRPNGTRYALWLAARRARQGRLAHAVAGRLTRRSRTSVGPSVDRPVVLRSLESARDQYVCRPTRVPTVIVRTTGYPAFEIPGWYLRSVFRNVVVDELIAAPHERVFRPPAVDDLSAAIGRSLDVLEREVTSANC